MGMNRVFKSKNHECKYVTIIIALCATTSIDYKIKHSIVINNPKKLIEGLYELCILIIPYIDTC